MQKKITLCDIYIILWVLYQLQGTLYSPGIINQFLQLLMILIAAIETIQVLLTKIKSPILKSTLLLLIMYCIYGSWFFLFVDNIRFNSGDYMVSYLYLQKSLMSLLPIFMFYSYTKKGILNEKRIMIYTIFILIVSVINYYENVNVASLNNKEDFTNNAAYSFVNIIPLICFYHKKPILQYFMLGFCFILVTMGMKRGAILIGVVSILIFIYFNLRFMSTRNKIITLVLSFFLLFWGVKFITNIAQSNSYFHSRIEQTLDGDSSGRDELYGTLWTTFKNETNPIIFLFGRGANATIGIVGDYAHNDWIETIINNGLVGGLILLAFIISISKIAYKQRKRFSTYMYSSFILLIIIIFSKTLFSMSIQSMALANSMLLGYLTYWSTQRNNLISYNIS